MIDVISFLPGKRKQTASGWISFNAPCCVHRGDTQDKRQRGGMKPSPDGSWSYHCFNCGYTASFVLGRNLTFKARKLLEWMNVPTEEIERINLESLKHKSIEGLLGERQEVIQRLQSIEFEDKDLPSETQELNDFAKEYLRNRCVPLDYPFLYKTMPRRGVVIPFTHNNQVVGHTTRFMDDRTPKYIQDIQHGYVFGTDLQKPNWQTAIVVEGVFDALSINGLAVLHAEINDAQVRLVRSLGREVVVVPDQDEAGMKLVDRAVELGWAVSIPEWPAGIKDVNDAVIRLGKLATLITIMQAKETSKIKIEIRKKWLIKKLKKS
jgi:energy-converting hydrogenase A subunit M